MSNVTCIGVKKVRNEGKGTESFMYYFNGEFTDYELENAECSGKTAIPEYSRADLGIKVGDRGTIVYSKGFQDKAVISGFIPLPANK